MPTFYMGPIDLILHLEKEQFPRGLMGYFDLCEMPPFFRNIPRYVILRYRHFSIACTVETVFMLSAVVYDLWLNVIVNYPGKLPLDLNQIFTRGRSHPGATPL